MKLGLVGLKNTGKTTLFNALTCSSADTSSYFNSSVKPNIGRVLIPDDRLEKLTKIFNPKKTTPPYIEFVDIAGLATGSNRSDGAGNQFLIHIREVDAIIHVVGFFNENDGSNIEANQDPVKDISSLNLELMISDLEIVEKRILSIEKKKRGIEPSEKLELEILLKIREGLEKEVPAINMDLSENEIKLIKSFCLLTLKPLIYCMNISEKDLGSDKGGPEFFPDVKDLADTKNTPIISVCAKIEEEISKLEPADKKIFMKDLNIGEPGLSKLIKASYSLLGYISFLTVGPDEVRAWTIKKGEKAPKAAGRIHSDIERGFIRAETISYPDFIESGGSFIKAKEKGLLRSEGKDYVVKDGDIIDFRFNV